MHQTCRKCNKYKPDNEFVIRNGKITNWCRDCKREYQQNHYHQNKQQTISRIKKHRKRIENWFKEFKQSLSCIICGENHPECLDFHHRNQSTKKYNISQMAYNGFSIDCIQKEIDKCDILCANCHRKLHATTDGC